MSVQCSFNDIKYPNELIELTNLSDEQLAQTRSRRISTSDDTDLLEKILYKVYNKPVSKSISDIKYNKRSFHLQRKLLLFF